MATWEVPRNATKNSEYLFARGSKPIADFRESWKQACQRAGVPIFFSTTFVELPFGIFGAQVAETVIMKITGHLTRSVFERYNITDHSDTKEAGRMAEEYLAREHEDLAQSTSHKRKAGLKVNRVSLLFCLVRMRGLEPPRVLPH